MSNYPGWEHYVPPTRADLQARAVNEATAKTPKPSKYHAVKTTTADGIVCDSKIEAARWAELKAMERAGMIRDLMPHPSFPLYVNGARVGRFTFDSLRVEDGKLIAEEVKSAATVKHAAFRSRLKTFQACYPGIHVKVEIR